MLLLQMSEYKMSNLRTASKSNGMDFEKQKKERPKVKVKVVLNMII